MGWMPDRTRWRVAGAPVAAVVGEGAAEVDCSDMAPIFPRWRPDAADALDGLTAHLARTYFTPPSIVLMLRPEGSRQISRPFCELPQITLAAADGASNL